MMKIADDDADEVCSINTLGGQLRCLSAASWSRREAGPTRGEGACLSSAARQKVTCFKLQQQQGEQGEQVANKNKNNLESIQVQHLQFIFTITFIHSYSYCPYIFIFHVKFINWSQLLLSCSHVSRVNNKKLLK